MEIWLPWIEIAGLAILPLVVLRLAFKLKRAQHRWQIPTTRVVSVIVAIPIWLFSLLLLSAQGCEEDRRLTGSPDGKHVARLMIWGSVPTGTSLRVIERRSWSPEWQVVSEASSIGTPLDPIEPWLTWSDNSHLVIDYPTSTDGTGFDCKNEQIGHILVECKSHSR